MLRTEVIEHMRIAVSYYCNLRCQHCYVPEVNRLNYQDLEAQQLSVEQIKNFIDMLISDFSLKKISVTGGEALHEKVWPRTKEIMGYAFSKGLDIQLNTSGSGNILMKDVIELAGDKLDKLLLHASFDGVEEEKVDKFRGRKGAMNKALKTIEDAVAGGVHVQARYTVTKDNYDDVEKCYEMLTQMGVESFMVKPMYAAGSARVNKELLILDRNKIKEMQARLVAMSINRKTRLDLPSPIFLDKKDIPQEANVKIINCVCGGEAGYVSFDGDVYPCTYLAGAPESEKYILGNIKDTNFDFKNTWLNTGLYDDFRTAKEHVCTTYEILYNVITKGDQKGETAVEEHVS